MWVVYHFVTYIRLLFWTAIYTILVCVLLYANIKYIIFYIFEIKRILGIYFIFIYLFFILIFSFVFYNIVRRLLMHTNLSLIRNFFLCRNMLWVYIIHMCTYLYILNTGLLKSFLLYRLLYTYLFRWIYIKHFLIITEFVSYVCYICL